MSKPKEQKTTFTAQPYPLYAWGMWTDPVVDDKYNVVDYDFNIDRLTIVGWMHQDEDVIPMVSTLLHGVAPLYAFTGNPEASDYVYKGKYSNISDEFILVDISITEPHSDVYKAAKRLHMLPLRVSELLATVVEEEASVI